MGHGSSVRRHLRACLSLLAGVALLAVFGPSLGARGSRLRSFPLPPETTYVAVLAAAGDIDGDGCGDLLLGDPISGFGPGGMAFAISGMDGSVLRAFDGPTYGGDDFGEAVASVGDLDGRGRPDVIVGAPGGAAGIPEDSQPTYARVFAGEDGAVIFDSGPHSPDEAFGRRVAGLGDTDGDGVPDFAVASMDRGGPAALAGAVHVFSGRTGALRKTLSPLVPAAPEYYGNSLAPLADVDGDGARDFAVGAPLASAGGLEYCGRIDVVSGKTLEVIRSVFGRREREGLGGRLAPLARSGAGARWLAAGVPDNDLFSPESPGGKVLLLEASTGRVLRELRNRVPFFGTTVAGLGDVDGDGFPDVAVGSSPKDLEGEDDYAGMVQVFSGESGGLLFSRRGSPGDQIQSTLCAIGDLDGDGRDELAYASREDGRVHVFRVEAGTVPASLRVALQRVGDAAGTAASGAVEIRMAGPQVALRVEARLPPGAGGYGQAEVYLEDGPSAGTFTAAGAIFEQGSRRREHRFSGVGRVTVPVSPPDAGLGDLAGRRVEVRVPFEGTVLLRAIVPTEKSREFRRFADLLAPPGAPAPGARASVRVDSSPADGGLRLRLRTSGLPRGTAPSAWIERSPGSGVFDLAGPLRRGRLLVDTARGDPLPGTAPDGESLSGRLIEVRGGEDVLLRGTMP